VSDQEVKINLNVNKDDDGANAEQSAEAQAVAADTVKADAEVAKLGADLEELRQTLLRRQLTLTITASGSRKSVLKTPSAPRLA